MESLANDTLIKSALLFGLVGFLYYYFVLQLRGPQQRRQQGQPTAQARNTNNNAVTRLQSATDARTNNNNASNSNGHVATSTLLKSPARLASHVPPHVSSTSAALAHENGINLLSSVDGLVAFRHTKAAAATKMTPVSSNNKGATTTSSNCSLSNRNYDADRALVVTKLLQLGRIAVLPPKGSVFVISLPMEQVVSSEKTRRVIYLLATWYNTLLVLVPNDKNKDITPTEREEIIEKIRVTNTETKGHSNSCCLSTDVLPTHRILWASTVQGRTALVRQLQKVALVVDFDNSIQETLSRFGYSVAIINTSTPSSSTVLKENLTVGDVLLKKDGM